MTLVMEAAVREAQAVSSHRDSCAKKTKTRDDEEADEDSQGEDDDASFASAESANPEETSPPPDASHVTHHPRDDCLRGRFSLILYAPQGTELDLRLVAALASTFQDNYPERLHKLYATPTGAVTRVVWEAVRPFLSQSVASKVVLASGGRRPAELRQAMPLKTLREAIVALDPFDEGEEDPWDAEDET